MKKTVRTLYFLATLVLVSSFTCLNNSSFIGTYAGSDADPAQIKLTIHADHTFYYQDLSNPGNKIIINGAWTLKGKKVVLTGNGAEQRFHNIWTFTENGQVARSRKGLAFYRLVKRG